MAQKCAPQTWRLSRGGSLSSRALNVPCSRFNKSRDKRCPRREETLPLTSLVRASLPYANVCWLFPWTSRQRHVIIDTSNVPVLTGGEWRRMGDRGPFWTSVPSVDDQASQLAYWGHEIFPAGSHVNISCSTDASGRASMAHTVNMNLASGHCP